jgi:5-methylcytosine-specific restriction endonuclease McrA
MTREDWTIEQREAETRRWYPRNCSARPCLDCGSIFTPTYGDKRRLYCSDLCGRRYKRKRRYALFGKESSKGRYVSLKRLGERDGWRCHICGRRVHSVDASADHLVPRSMGGSNRMINLRLAHLICNSRRGAGRTPAQLLLMGR